jgi:hypothetical protein
MTMQSRCRAGALAALVLVALVAVPAAGVAHADVLDDTTPPTTPTNLRVVELSFNEVTLAWDASTDDSGWLMYETEVVASGNAHRFGVVEPTRTYPLLVQGLTYTATVWAVDGARNLSDPVTIQFTTPVDSEPPSTPTDLRFEMRAGFPRGVITWDAAVDNSDSITYDLFVESAFGSGPVAHPTDLQVSVGDLLDSHVIQPGIPYTFSVEARDVAGNLSPRSAPLTLTF